MGLVGADGFHDLCNFGRRKAGLQKCCRRLLHRVADIIPAGKFDRVFGPMTDKHAQIMQPRRGVHHIVVVGEPPADQSSQRIEPRLMPQLIHRQSLAAHILRQRGTKVVACVDTAFCVA